MKNRASVWVVCSITVFGTMNMGCGKDTDKSVPVAAHKDIKQQIRSGKLDPESGPRKPAPPLRPPLALSQIFEIQEPHKFYTALEDHISHKVATAPGESWSCLNASEKAVLAIYGLEAEVNNGGFDQYFFNSAGDTAKEALEGLELIGAKKMGNILRKAMAVFPDGSPSPDRDKRWKQMDLIEKEAAKIWNALDSEFFEYPDKIDDLLFKFCNEHRRDFMP